MNALLERLGAVAARRRWWVIAVWVLVLVGLSVARGAFGGTYVNDYSVPGSQSSDGLNVLTKDFAAASGYSGPDRVPRDDREGLGPGRRGEHLDENVGGLATCCLPTTR